jgi:hypothetical protein
MADLERVLDAHQVAVVPNASRPALLLLAGHSATNHKPRLI